MSQISTCLQWIRVTAAAPQELSGYLLYVLLISTHLGLAYSDSATFFNSLTSIILLSKYNNSARSSVYKIRQVLGVENPSQKNLTGAKH